LYQSHDMEVALPLLQNIFTIKMSLTSFRNLLL